MERTLSRKERQLEELKLTANNGKTELLARMYSHEAKYWSKKGFKILKLSPPTNGKGLYVVSFEKKELLNFSVNNQYIVGFIKDLPRELTLPEKLFLISQKSKVQKRAFEESFMD